jgi:hypothetical protein
VPHCARGHEFHFLRSQFVVFATGDLAAAPEELGRMIPRMSTGSIYYHFIDARHREPLLEDDFTAWLKSWGDAYEPIVRRLAHVDVYLWSLSELRERVAACFEAAAAHGGVR